MPLIVFPQLCAVLTKSYKESKRSSHVIYSLCVGLAATTAIIAQSLGHSIPSIAFCKWVIIDDIQATPVCMPLLDYRCRTAVGISKHDGFNQSVRY
jgi:hypothetical protein